MWYTCNFILLFFFFVFFRLLISRILHVLCDSSAIRNNISRTKKTSRKYSKLSREMRTFPFPITNVIFMWPPAYYRYIGPPPRIQIRKPNQNKENRFLFSLLFPGFPCGAYFRVLLGGTQFGARVQQRIYILTEELTVLR